MVKRSFSRTIAIGLLAVGFARTPALAEPPQTSIATPAQKIMAPTEKITLFLESAPRNPSGFIAAVFDHVKNDGKGGFSTVPTDQSKGALRVHEYEYAKAGDCTDTDLYANAIIIYAREKGIIPKDAVIGTAVYKPEANPDMGHVVTFVSHDSMAPSNAPLALEISRELGGKPVTIIDPAAKEFGGVKHAGALLHIVTNGERTGLFFKEQADAAFRLNDHVLARKLFERAYEFLKENKKASQEIREKLGTYAFNDGVDALRKDDFDSARTAIQKAQGYTPKPLYEAHLVYIIGMESYAKGDVASAKMKFTQSRDILKSITGNDEKTARAFLRNVEGVLSQIQ